MEIIHSLMFQHPCHCRNTQGQLLDKSYSFSFIFRASDINSHEICLIGYLKSYWSYVVNNEIEKKIRGKNVCKSNSSTWRDYSMIQQNLFFHNSNVCYYYILSKTWRSNCNLPQSNRFLLVLVHQHAFTEYPVWPKNCIGCCTAPGLKN